jgi:hypothetical protein
MSNRIMLDCPGANAVTLHNLQPEIAIVGCYVTGTSDVIWSDAERALWEFHTTIVTIDQGYESPNVTTATVRDVEAEAWTADKAVELDTWSPDVARPTIYCDVDDLPDVLSGGWKGDLWLAIPGWVTGDPLPDHGDCTVVAVQDRQNVNGLYDSSIVLDSFWPDKEPITVSTTEQQSGWRWCGKCQSLFYGPNIKSSACVRGGAHEDNGSGDYTLTVVVTS